MGKQIILRSFTATKFLDDDPVLSHVPFSNPVRFENFVIELYADSCRKVFESPRFDLKQGQTKRFTDFGPVTCLKSMEMVLIEEDGGGHVDAGIDDDTDEIIPPVDLLWPQDSDLVQVSEVPESGGRTITLTLTHPTQHGEFVLVYFIIDYWERADDLVSTTRASSNLYVTDQSDARLPIRNLADDKGACRWICSIDGGGMRGILALRALEQVERYYDKPCNEIFDMYACTSTGALIGATLAAGVPLSEIIALYCSRDMRDHIWQKANAEEENALYNLPIFTGDGAKSSGTIREWLDWYDLDVSVSDTPEKLLRENMSGIAQILLAPWYDKKGIVSILNTLYATGGGSDFHFLTLGELKKDILITAYDTFQQQTTVFSAFHSGGAQASSGGPSNPFFTSPAGGVEPNISILGGLGIAGLRNVYGRYQSVLVKDAVECSMSAPVFFAPRERFVDGGVGSYNNPVLLAAYTALHESHLYPAGPLAVAGAPLYRPFDDSGPVPKGTVIWSFGTGTSVDEDPEQAALRIRPTFSDAGSTLDPRPDRTFAADPNRPIFATYWAGKLIEVFMGSANDQQTEIVRKLMADQVKLVRCNMQISNAVVAQFGTGEQSKSSLLFAPDHDQFDQMDAVAKGYAAALRRDRFGFDEGGRYFRPLVDGVDGEDYADLVKRSLARYS